MELMCLWESEWKIVHRNAQGHEIFSGVFHNITVDEGKKPIIDVFLRKQDSVYFGSDNLYIGLYRGTISRTTTLLTIPGEPSGNGYSRATVGRSLVGWPTIEQDENGNWRLISQTITVEASGGDIGPVDGPFLATSLDNTGQLICTVAGPTERTIKSGESLEFQMRVKCSGG